MAARTAIRRTGVLCLVAVFVLFLCSTGCQKTTARGQYDIAIGGSTTR